MDSLMQSDVVFLSFFMSFAMRKISMTSKSCSMILSDSFMARLLLIVGCGIHSVAEGCRAAKWMGLQHDHP